MLCGDFFQLPPVNKDNTNEANFITSSRAWQELSPVICYLEEQHRQSQDVLLDILTAMRSNDLRRHHVEFLMGRIIERTPFDEPVTELYTRNVDVDAINDEYLGRINSPEEVFEMASTGRSSAVASLKKSCLAPEVLRLKIGSFVMFVKNSADKKYVNGTLGTVVAFEELTGLPIIQTRDGRSITAKQDTWELKDGNKKLASLAQLPLRLAWAITIHKSQGMTLDAAHIDLRNAFVPGMGYVALSRVRALESLTLAGINKMALTLHPVAYAIDDELRAKSLIDEERCAKLEKAFLKKLKNLQKSDSTKKPKPGAWAEKLAEMRKSHPKAFMPWTAEDDDALLSGWNSQTSIASLSKKLGRHEGSIKARLKKHFGEDLEI